MPNFIRLKQINQPELSGFFIDSTTTLTSGITESIVNNIVTDKFVLRTGDQTISGIKTFTNTINIVSGINPQSIRVFDSTGINSGEFGLFGWQNDQLIIGTQQSQSGILRNVLITGRDIIINSSGNLNIFDPTNISGNLNVSGTGIFKALDLSNIGTLNLSGIDINFNSIDNLSLSGVDISITSGFVVLTNPISAPNIVYNTGNQTISGNKTFANNLNVSGDLTVADFPINPYPPQFPAWTGIRRYAPLDLLSVTTATPLSGIICYFPFLIKKNVTNPVACVEMTTYFINDPKIVIGIYSGHYGFENARLITSGSITGNINNTGIYRTTLNGTFKQGPYIIGSVLASGQGSIFRQSSSQGYREHIGINTGSPILHGLNNTALTNHIYESGVDNTLNSTIGTGIWVSSATAGLGPLVFLEY